MSGYDVSAVSSADPHRIFSLLLDGSTWPQWSPIDSFESEPLADGGEVRLFRTGTNVSRERVTGTRADRQLLYEMTSGGRGLLRRYRGQIDLQPLPDGGTRIRWRATWYSPIPGAGLVMQRYLTGFQQRMVDGLAEHAARP